MRHYKTTKKDVTDDKVNILFKVAAFYNPFRFPWSFFRYDWLPVVRDPPFRPGLGVLWNALGVRPDCSTRFRHVRGVYKVALLENVRLHDRLVQGHTGKVSRQSKYV